MGIAEFLFGEKSNVVLGSLPSEGGVGFVQLDCSVNETHTDTAEITNHPIEDGSDITDHIRKLPTTLEISGLITNTPIAYLASINAKPSTFASDGFVSSTPSSNRVDDGYSLLQQMMENGVTMTVITTLRNYEDMAIENLVVTRDSNTAEALDCVISLREVKKAKALSIDLPVPEKVSNKKKKKKGKKDTKASSNEQSKSMAASAADFGGSLLGF